MNQDPTAFTLFRIGFARILDATGMLLLAWLCFQVLFGGSQLFETEALWVGGIGAVAGLIAPGARRTVPLPMVAYVAVALLSAAVHQWPKVASAPELNWWALAEPAMYLVTMFVFVFGIAHFLRSPTRLSWSAVVLVASIGVLAVQVLFDRVGTNYSYIRGGSASLPTVAQWGGLHQAGMLLVLAIPFPLALAALGRTLSRITAGLVLAGGYVVAALVNGSNGGIVAMGVITLLLPVGVLAQRVNGKRLRVALVVSLAAVLVAALFMVVSGRVSFLAKGDIAGRIPIWLAGTALFRDHLALGVGPGGYSAAILDAGYAARYLREGSAGMHQAHNMLLHTAAELGIAGLVSLLWLWWWLIRACWQAWSHNRSAVVACGLLFAIIGFFVRSMSDHFLDGLPTTDRTRVLVWMLFAAAVALARPRRDPLQVEP